MLYNLAKSRCIMNKVLDCLSHNGFVLNKNRAFATIDGYHFNAMYSGGLSSVLKLHVSFFATFEQQRLIKMTLQNSGIHGTQINLTDFGAEIVLSGMSATTLSSLIPAVLTFVTTTLKNYKALNCNYCPVCGAELSPEEQRLVKVQENYIALDDKCIDRLNEILDKKYNLANQSPNYGKGFLGALLGAFIGGLVGLGSSFLGGIPLVAVILSVVLGMFFYKKFNARQNNVMFVMVGCLTFVFQVVATVISFMLSALIAVKTMGGSSNMWEGFVQCMMLPEFARLFYISLIVTIVITALCIFLAFFTERKKQPKLISK